ncbi:MAG: heparinase II/III-family protein, partial [Candidatus Hodarchaeota archaeon]
QKELTQHYHGVVVRNSEIILAACKALNITLHPSFTKKVQDMWSYLAWITRPNGKSLNNNDSDLDDWGEHLILKARQHDRPDWTYIATNGESGEKPRAGITGGVSNNNLSLVFPWSGHVIMRESWKHDVKWSFFDIGPFGTGHQHRDKLHVSVDAFGHHWLVDSGRYWYKGGYWRENYFLNTRSHNTVIFSDIGQQEFELEAEKPVEKQFISMDQFDYAIGRYDKRYGLSWRDITNIPNFDDLFEPMLDRLDEAGSLEVIGGLSLKRPLSHARAVCYIRDKYWLVVDSIETGHLQIAQILWHFHPSCKVEIEEKNKNIVASREDGTMFTIHPVTTETMEVELKRGVGEPLPQGWWSREYNHKEPATCAVYTCPVDKPAQIAWLLCPQKSSDAIPSVKRLPSSSEKEVIYEINGKKLMLSIDVDNPSCELIE